MFAKFLMLEWKSFVRSASLGKSIALKIFMAFIAVYFLLMFLITGLFLHDALQQFFPGQNAMTVVNRFAIIWLAADLMMRFFMQSLPVMNIKPLMLLPIARKTQVHFVLLKSLFSFFNLLPLLVIIPFGLDAISHGTVSPASGAAWIGMMVLLTVTVNYTNFIIKKKFAEKLKAFLPFVAIAIVLVALEYFGIFKITVVVGKALNFIIAMPALAVVIIALPIGMYFWNLAYLAGNFYLDASLGQKATNTDTKDFGWTRRFGEIAPFLQLDLKLIFRNKRPRATLMLSFIFLFYGLIFLNGGSERHSSGEFSHVFLGIFITGIFMINFGQFIPAWDSGYYSLIMSQNIRVRNYLASKAGLLTFSVVVLTILATPYAYFGVKVLATIIACGLYNIGVNIPLILFAGSFNRKKISLEKSPFMNYQGTGATQWIIGIPLLLVPMGIWIAVKVFGGYYAASGALAVFGFIGIALRTFLMEKIAVAYGKSKYAAISGFKEDEN